ncbi:MAG: hypothetical protein IKY14_00900 [Erysipelotrichaceae bacterium]|nr:hypothetical protein [Erysipelotrichaceae bacterium]
MAYPTLNANELNTSLFNQIISQELFARIDQGGSLVDKARVDGSLLGDTKTYFAADAIHTRPFVQDSEDELNLLAVKRNKSVRTQAIKLDVFRIAETTTDDLMTKRAWSTEGAFADYNSLLNQMVPISKYLHECTTYDTFIGTLCKGTKGKQNPSGLVLTKGKVGRQIANFVATVMKDMIHPSRSYNEYEHITKFSMKDIKIVWNTRWVDLIEKIDLPVTFNPDFMDKFGEDQVHESYWGNKVSLADVSSNTPSTTHPVKKTGAVYTFEPVSGNTVILRPTEEVRIPCSDGETYAEFFAGEEIVNPEGKTLVLTDFGDKLYVQDNDYICKLFIKYPPLLGACNLSSEFYNPKNHSTNRYLVFGRNSLAAYEAYPCVTIKAASVNEPVVNALVVNDSDNPVVTQEVAE